MIQFVVWGAGGRGKIVAEILGTDRIVAFIDSDPKKAGGIFLDKPIIDFSCYKSNYDQYAILNSLVAAKTVTDILKKEAFFFFIYNECPPELMGYGWRYAQKRKNIFDIPDKVAVYGHTLYSILVYEYLENAGHECIALIHNTPLSETESESFNRMFPFITVKELNDIEPDTTILQTVSGYDCEKELLERTVKNIFDWKDHIPEYYNSKIAMLHNKYKEKRCFIVATGPSLKFEDLEKLNHNHEFCISLNEIFYCFDKTSWRPDQYAVVDVDSINFHDSDIRKMDVKEKFIADASMSFDYESLTDEFYVYHSIFTKNTLEQGLISDDFAKYVYNTGTITAVCLQLAMYEGFREIYLLGCDCSYFQTGLQHFCEPEDIVEKNCNTYGMMDSNLQTLYYHINAYEKIKDNAEHKGIKIYNATRGGYLEVFERVNFDELF